MLFREKPINKFQDADKRAQPKGYGFYDRRNVVHFLSTSVTLLTRQVLLQRTAHVGWVATEKFR
jgi:hypothetical protein